MKGSLMRRKIKTRKKEDGKSGKMKISAKPVT